MEREYHEFIVPFSPLRLFLLLLAIGLVVAFVQIGVISIAFEKLGLSPNSAFYLLFAFLLGSMINVPLFQMNAEPPPPGMQPPPLPFPFRLPQREFTGKMIIAVNAGGCLIPLAFSAYLLLNYPVNPLQALIVASAVTAVSYALSRPIPGLGIGMPMLVAPLTAALTAVTLNPQQGAPLAYIGGTVGVLMGADILHLKDIRKMGVPFAAIGGAGTFDGIFLTGIIAVLLA